MVDSHYSPVLSVFCTTVSEFAVEFTATAITSSCSVPSYLEEKSHRQAELPHHFSIELMGEATVETTRADAAWCG